MYYCTLRPYPAWSRPIFSRTDLSTKIYRTNFINKKNLLQCMQTLSLVNFHIFYHSKGLHMQTSHRDHNPEVSQEHSLFDVRWEQYSLSPVHLYF